jgi:hypothetical protein
LPGQSDAAVDRPASAIKAATMDFTRELQERQATIPDLGSLPAGLHGLGNGLPSSRTSSCTVSRRTTLSNASVQTLRWWSNDTNN